MIREHTWRPTFPTDLAATLLVLRHGPADPTFAVGDDGAIWSTTRTVDGPATLRIRAVGSVMLGVTAWGPGADAAVTSAPDRCGERDDPTGFVSHLPMLDDLHRQHPGIRVPRTGGVWEALVPAILEQKVIVAQAHDAWRTLVLRFGERAPKPTGGGSTPGDGVAWPRGLWVVPNIEGWASIPSWEWHRAGVQPTQARTVQRAARLATSLERLADLPAAEARERLASVSGIGEWTAAEVAQRALGDADAVSVGDYHLAKDVGWALARRPFDDAELVATLAPWSPHRYRVTRLLRTLGGRPRRTPRLALVDHRWH